jgi:hypothetical protein
VKSRFTVILFLIGFLGTASSQEKKQGCDINQEIYKNSTPTDMLIKMEFKDGCPDADSYVYVYDAGGKEVSRYTVPDMRTRTFNLDVPASGAIRFNCRGKGHSSSDCCSSRLISETPE